LLDKSGRDSLAQIKRYFSKNNLIQTIRNNFAFHYAGDDLRSRLECTNDRDNFASTALRDAKGWFIRTDLVKLIHNVHSGDELSVHPTWEFRIRRQISKWRRDGQ
jgi:hypothetical protein